MRPLALASLLMLALAGRAGADGIDNLSAFTRLLSLVRFFHPSDQAAAADWNRVAVAGVKAVEGAEDPEALARALEGFFQPLAPTLRVVREGQRPETPAELRPPSEVSRIVAWRHHGGGFGATGANTKVFRSERIDDRNPPGFGTLAQAVPAGPLRGKKVRLRAWVRAEMEGDGKAQLGLRVDRADGKPGFFDNMADRPIREPEWRLYEIEGDVAPDAERILVMLVVSGAGRVWIDEVSLTPALAHAAHVANTAFDEGEAGAQPPGWMFPYESIRAGFHLVLRRGGECRKGGCAEIVGDAIAAPQFRRPEEVLELDLGAGVAAFLPVSLYADERGTLPGGTPALPPADPGPDTRETRLAAVALAWGILQHLHPWLDAEVPAWREGLRPMLAAASAPDREAFLRAFRRFLVPLRDTRAFVRATTEPEQRLLPLAWEWIEDRLVVTGVAEGTRDIRAGDVVVALDGRPVEEVLAEEEGLASAATPEARRWQALDRLLWGPADSRVTLRLQGSGDVTLARNVPYDRLTFGTPLPGIAEPRPGVVYVDLGRIEEEGLGPLLPRLAAARGIVFDLRHGVNLSNVLLSHLTERTVASHNWQVPVVMAPDRQGVEWMTTFWTIGPKAPRLRGKVAFLVDGRVDGYGETVLGMIEEHRLGEIVGSRSGGCNGSPNRSGLPGGYRLMWTGQRVLKRDGSPLHGVGVAATVPASRTLAGVAAGRDEIVERAVETVLGRD